MLRDITIGQHFPGNSLVHKFDPRLKLVLTIVYIILLFAASNPLGLTLSILFLVGMYAVAKIPFKLILKSLKPILPIVVFTAVLNLFFVSGEGEPLVHIGFLTVYAEGVKYAILMAVRVMALIAGTSALMRSVILPVSSWAPRAFWAFMILSVSSMRVGMKRSAMLIIMASSCTGKWILPSGLSSCSMASVSTMGLGG